MGTCQPYEGKEISRATETEEAKKMKIRKKIEEESPPLWIEASSL